MSGEPLVSQFVDAVDKVVAQFCGQEMTTAEAIGALELVKAKIIRDAMEAEDDELPL